MEIWNKIPGYENYEASNYGRIRSLDRFEFYSRLGKTVKRYRPGRIIKLRKNPKGYLFFDTGLRKKKIRVHRAVAMAFLGLSENPEMQINHKNGIVSDNNLENLEIVSCRENLLHARNTGLLTRNQKNTFLSKEEVETIRFFGGSGYGVKVILAKVFNRSRATIADVVYGRSYK